MGGQVGFRHIGGEPARFGAVEELGLETSLAYQQRAGDDGAGVIGELCEGGVGIGDVRGIELPDITIDDYLSEQIMLRENGSGRAKRQSHGDPL